MSVTVESVMCIKDEINDLISCINLETIAEPINTHFCREHCVKHEILQFEQGDLFSVERGERVCFVHAPIISIGFGGLRPLVCHFANWSEAADQFLLLCSKMCLGSYYWNRTINFVHVVTYTFTV